MGSSDEDIAEEQLLRVIEGKPAKKGSPKALNLIDKISGKFRMMSVGSGRGAASISLGGILQFNMRLLNYLLWVVLTCICIYLIVDFILFQVRSKETFVINQPVAVEQDATATAIPVVKPEDHMTPIKDYLASFRQRNAFTGSKEGMAPAAAEDEGPTLQEQLQEMIQGLVIVGINRSQNSEAFIEDTNAKKTYFVTAGQTVKGMLVKEVRADTVLFEYEGAEIELI